MNGFSDVHVSFSADVAHARTRLANRWSAVVDPPPGVWIGTARGHAGSPVLHTADSPGWRLWSVGDLHTYRGDPADVLGRLAADLAHGVAEPGLLDAHAVVFAWEHGARRLHVLVDRMGTVHAYAGKEADRIDQRRRVDLHVHVAERLRQVQTALDPLQRTFAVQLPLADAKHALDAAGVDAPAFAGGPAAPSTH